MRKYYTHDLGDEPAFGFGEASAVYLAAEADARIAEIERIGRDYIARTDPLLDQLEPLSNRIAELEQALRTYGGHKEECAAIVAGACDCGFGEVIGSTNAHS